MLVCSNCGQENPEIARFCLACGTRLAAAPAPPGEERKVITVLFCDLVGFTAQAERLDPEDVRAGLAPFYGRVRSELERHGGTVEKFIGDAVMAVFGAPVVHEDDPERAVRAALAIRDAVGELGDLDLHVRLGVTTGEALVAIGVRPSEAEWMVAGDIVNTAARLQTAAPVDGILVDQATYRATRELIDYTEHVPVQAKGKAEPVPVWLVGQPRAQHGVSLRGKAETPFVGRAHELGLLRDAFARARAERAPQLVTLIGAPGIGKSRLVAELAREADEDAELIFWRQGRCLPYGEGISFWALSEILKSQAGVLETDDAGRAHERLDEAVETFIHDPAEAGWVKEHLQPLLGLGGEVELSGDRRDQTFAAWRRFFEALAAQRPLVLAFEDVHWAGDGLLDFIDFLVDWVVGVPLFVICTARPDLLSRRAGWGGGKANAVTLSLASLSEEESARLLSVLLDYAILPAELKAALVSRAGGNPLYAEEFVRMLQERGGIERVDGHWRLGSVDRLPLPDSVQAIIAARIDALTADEKAVLQDAAVIGKVFWGGALAGVGQRPFAVLETLLGELERKEFVRQRQRSSVASEPEYEFRHLLVRDIAYAQIPRARRADKHLLAAAWMELLSPDRSEDRSEMLAHHYLRALELVRAANRSPAFLVTPARRALKDAGDHAFALNSYAAADRFYTEALALWPDSDAERPRLLLRLGQVLHLADNDRRLDVLDEAREALLESGERDGAAEVEALMADACWYRGEREQALEHLDRARDLVADAEPSVAKTRVLSAVSRHQMVAGQYGEALRAGREALALAEQLGLEELRAHALDNIGTARFRMGDPAGLREVRQSVEIALAVNSPEAVRGLNNLAAMTLRRGDARRARELWREAMPLAERLGAGTLLRYVRGSEPTNQFEEGDWDEALRLADAFILECESSPNYHEPAVRYVRAHIRLGRGDDDGALEDIDRGVTRAREIQDPQILLPTLSYAAFVDAELGRLGEARAAGDEILEAAGRGVIDPTPAFLYLVFAAARIGRVDEVRELVEGSFGTSPWPAAARAILAGDARQGAEILEAIGALSDEAFARLVAAEQLAAQGRRSEANEQLRVATAFYGAVGATAFVERRESLLAA